MFRLFGDSFLICLTACELVEYPWCGVKHQSGCMHRKPQVGKENQRGEIVFEKRDFSLLEPLSISAAPGQRCGA